MSLLPGLQEQRMPKAAIAFVIAISILPFLLILAGVEFGSRGVEAAGVSANDPNAAYHALKGDFVHTILEWSAVGIAVITVLLAFLHYHEKGEATTPIIGLAWFCAGLIDAVHTLGADRLFPVMTDHEAFTEFTWLISRTVNILILLMGAALFVITGQTLSREQRKRGTGFVLAVTGIFALATVGILYVCATRPSLPEILHPASSVPRPLDLIPLALYVLAAAMVFPGFYKWHSSVFTHALLISMAPHIAAQLHMAFGSSAIFDGHYQVAHFLKVVAYAVPLVGLLMDYRLTHAQEMLAQEERAGEFFVRQQAEEALATDRSVLRILMDNTGDLVSIKDASLRFTRVNKKQAQFLGLASPMDAVGKSESDYFDAGAVAESRKKDQQVLADGKPVVDLNLQVTRQVQEIQRERAPDMMASVYMEKKVSKPGEVSRLAMSKFPLKNTEGKIVGVIVISRPL